MVNNLIGSDIELMRKRYDEALALRGIPAKYQQPLMADTNAQGEPVVEAYSEYLPTHIFFDGNPKIKTFKRYGWVVENDSNLPFLIHCSFNLPNVQRDSLFTLSGQYSGLPDRVFRVIEITMDLQAPDHLIAQVVPVYEKQTVGRTEHEIKKTFNTSNHFLNPNTDYRGDTYTPSEERS
jgi:hypothetical protein